MLLNAIYVYIYSYTMPIPGYIYKMKMFLSLIYTLLIDKPFRIYIETLGGWFNIKLHITLTFFGYKVRMENRPFNRCTTC